MAIGHPQLAAGLPGKQACLHCVRRILLGCSNWSMPPAGKHWSAHGRAGHSAAASRQAWDEESSSALQRKSSSRPATACQGASRGHSGPRKHRRQPLVRTDAAARHVRTPCTSQVLSEFPAWFTRSIAVTPPRLQEGATKDGQDAQDQAVAAVQALSRIARDASSYFRDERLALVRRASVWECSPLKPCRGLASREFTTSRPVQSALAGPRLWLPQALCVHKRAPGHAVSSELAPAQPAHRPVLLGAAVLASRTDPRTPALPWQHRPCQGGLHAGPPCLCMSCKRCCWARCQGAHAAPCA